jgi:hypothetical protein
MLKVQLKNVRIRLRIGWYSQGSVLAGTISSGCTGVETEVEVQSDDNPALIAALIQNARGGCYAEAALTQALVVKATATLNGADFDFGKYPSRPPRG